MATDAARHYRELLAEHYTWMLGVPFAAKVDEQRALLRRLGALPKRGGLAVDLGCGPGFQALALADLGFGDVLAMDTSEALLGELARATEGRPIRAVHADMRALSEHVAPGAAELIVCMGDTLTHLPAAADVDALFAAACAALAPDGQLVLTFRDLSVALEGLSRFIALRSDAERVMTCFLEYGDTNVTVHDLVHVRRGDAWELHKSAYDKLRLSPADVARKLERAGLVVTRTEPAERLWAIVAAKAPSASVGAK